MQNKPGTIRQVLYKWRLIPIVISLIIPILVGCYVGKSFSKRDFGRRLYITLMIKKAIITDNQGYFQEIPYIMDSVQKAAQPMPKAVQTGNKLAQDGSNNNLMMNTHDGTVDTTKVSNMDGANDAQSMGQEPEPQHSMREDLKYPSSPKLPIISIIIQDFGENKSADKFIMQNMPPLTSVTISPYLEDHADLIAKAYDNKLAPIIKVSMEPDDYPASDPGFNTLLSGLKQSELLDRIKWYLKIESDALINFMGSKFLRDKNGVRTFLDYLAKNEKVFIDDGTTPASVSAKIGQASGVKMLSIDINLANSWLNGTTLAQLKNAEKIAKKSGYCMIMCDNNLKLLQLVASWLKKHKKHFEVRAAEEVIYLKAKGRL